MQPVMAFKFMMLQGFKHCSGPILKSKQLWSVCITYFYCLLGLPFDTDRLSGCSRCLRSVTKMSTNGFGSYTHKHVFHALADFDAGLLATRAAATAEGNPDAAEKTKINQMFSSGILKPFAEPFTMYYQVRKASGHACLTLLVKTCDNKQQQYMISKAAVQ